MARKYEEQDILITVEVLNNVGDKLASEIDNITQTELPAIESDIEDINHQIDEGVSAPLIIVIRGSESYEGKGVTAKSKIDGREYHSTITDGVTYIKVKSPGEYIITNEYDDSSLSAVVGDPLDEEVYFTDYYGSINVTVPDILIGETIRAEYQGHTVEKLIESKIEILSVNFKGQWEVGIKDNTYIQKQTVDMQEIGDSKTCNLSVGEGVPYITVTLADELVGETIVCKKEESQKSKLGKTNTVQFLVNQLGHYTICLERSELLSKTAEVNSTEEVKVTLDLNDLTVPVLIVRSKEEDNGKTIKVTKGEKSYQRELKDRFALFILEETGQWTVSCDLIPDTVKNVQCDENKLYEVAYRYSLFTIQVRQSESDPGKRIEKPQDNNDLYGLTPITVTFLTGEANYGDMENTFLFKAFNNPVLLSMDGREEIPLDPNDYSKKLGGGTAPVATVNNVYNQFNKISKLYTYEYTSNGYEYINISDTKINEHYEALGFQREDGSEAPAVYVGCFLGTWDDQERLRSVPNGSVKSYQGPQTQIQAARKNGEGYTLSPYSVINLIQNTILMMAQNFRCALVLGEGRGLNDTYPTGFTNDKGPVALCRVSGNNGYNCIKFMHIEDFYMDNGEELIEGVLFRNSKTYVRMKPPYITDDSQGFSTYTEVTGAATTTGIISKSTVDNKWGRVPSSVTGDQYKYECAGFTPYAKDDHLCGAYRGVKTITHLSQIKFNDTAPGGFAGRLCYLPPKK